MLSTRSVQATRLAGHGITPSTAAGLLAARQQRCLVQQRALQSPERPLSPQLILSPARPSVAAAAVAVDIPVMPAPERRSGVDLPAIFAGAAAAIAAAAAALALLTSGNGGFDDGPFVPVRPKTLAETVAPRYRRLDANGDGLISRAELAPLETDLWLKWAEGAAPRTRVEVTSDGRWLSPFDHYVDNSLTASQVQHYLGLEGAINANGCVTKAVWQVFDANGDGGVDKQEWSRALGDLGEDGNAAKRMVFNRTDRLANAKGKLRGEEFKIALREIRGVVAGGGGAESVVFGRF